MLSLSTYRIGKLDSVHRGDGVGGGRISRRPEKVASWDVAASLYHSCPGHASAGVKGETAVSTCELMILGWVSRLAAISNHMNNDGRVSIVQVGRRRMPRAGDTRNA